MNTACTDGVRCWGKSGFKQLGYATDSNVNNATATTNIYMGSGGVYAVAIAAGQMHTCVILNTGKLNCWGNQQNGESRACSSISISALVTKSVLL
jgi:alpha-tubulin suppressor-like RCC1 family protein